MFKSFARTRASHRRGLLGWDSYPISTYPLEGPTTRSAHVRDQTMASEIRITSSFNSMHFTKRDSYSWDSFEARDCRMSA